MHDIFNVKVLTTGDFPILFMGEYWDLGSEQKQQKSDVTALYLNLSH